MQLLLPRARRHARAPLSCALLLALGLLLGLTLAPARAATLTVTNINDSGSGSLRAAIATANTDGGDDTINFSIPASIYPKIILSSTLTITAPMTISGPSGQNIVIDGGSSVRVFRISGGTTVEPVAFAGLTIADGNSLPSNIDYTDGEGGGIYNAPGDVLTLTGCTLFANTANGGAGRRPLQRRRHGDSDGLHLQPKTAPPAARAAASTTDGHGNADGLHLRRQTASTAAARAAASSSTTARRR